MEAKLSRRDLLVAAGGASVALVAGKAHGQPSGDAPAKSAPAYRSARELMAALSARQVSSIELVDASIARIEALDSGINAVVVRDFDRARKTAREADAARARGDRRPLLGLPMTVKEAFDVAGLTTTWGNPAFKGWQPAKDAVVVARAREAGAIILGKTNVPFMLGDFQSYNDLYGTTNNPWDLTRTPGGSSGGSAAALAAGFISLEIGSDFGGSVRAPAHYCGVYGHKPTHRLVSIRGHNGPRSNPLPGWGDLVVPGPMARYADDLTLALDVLAGPDLPESAGLRLALPRPRHTELRNYRVLLIDAHPLIPTSAAVATALDQMGDRLTKAKCKVARASPLLPDLARNARTYALLMNALSGSLIDAKTYERAKETATSIPEDTTDLVELRARGTVLSYRAWANAHRARGEMQQQWREFFREFDVVVCPVHPTPAWPHDHSEWGKRLLEVDGKTYPWADTLRAWGGVATVPGLPATAVPIGLSNTGLPIGAQIVGPEFEDYTTISFARLMEREFGGFIAPPAFA